MQGIENQLPNAFTNIKNVTKFIHIGHKYPDTYWCLWRTIGECHRSEYEIRLKRGRPIGSNDLVPRKKTYEKLGTLQELTNIKRWNDET